MSLLLICSLPGIIPDLQAQGFDKPGYYKVIESGTVDEIDLEFNQVKGSPAAEKEAFEGTLLMKKASLVSKPKDKLSFFKSGRIKLEDAIEKNSNNIEFRFLRVIIQEHAPKIVKYKSNIEEDCKMILDNFKSLPPILQQQIAHYSKTSKVLKTP